MREIYYIQIPHRNIKLEDTFFEVSLCRLYWEEEQPNDRFFISPTKIIPCPGFLAVVNMLTTV